MKTAAALPAGDLERRKKVRLRLRADLSIARHRYEGKSYYIVKDPVSLRYYRFKEQEHFLLRLMDGKHSLDDAQKSFEKRFRPERLKLEDLEAFGQQLLTAGLAHNESPQAGKQLFTRRKKRLRRETMAYLTNILYIKIPVLDPDKLLSKMLPYLRWVFTLWSFAASLLLMLGALMLVATHFETFRDKLPEYHEFFSFKTVVYLWAALGVVKVIHEFGHGLSCKAFGGEVHEMGLLFLCLSPAMYCNVSDAWTMPNKWHRIIISFAGIYVELVIASIATFVWWNSPSHPFINYLSLSLMVVCSVSTVLFNGNPLMRYDGYYVLADWIEIPNLRDRCNRFIRQLFLEHALGVEVHREPYMALGRRILFVLYAVVSYVYKWVVTFGVLFFMSTFLGAKLRVLSSMLAIFSLGSMVGWPLWQFAQGYAKRGRLPDMKPVRVSITAGVAAVLLLMFFFVPLPISRVRQTALVQLDPEAIEKVFVPNPGSVILKGLKAANGETVRKNDPLAVFTSPEVEEQLEEAQTLVDVNKQGINSINQQMSTSGLESGERSRLVKDLEERRGQMAVSQARFLHSRELREKLTVKAPRDGVVYGLPLIDDIGKTWEQDQEKPFCSVGDPGKLQALVPVPPVDHRLLQSDLAAQGRPMTASLPATIRVQGRGGQTWTGVVTQLPQADAKEVPAALANKQGGPLAVKAGANPRIFVPQSQQYLVAVEIQDPDRAICPGTLAQVKIHCRWHSCAWWVWRTVSLTFDLGLNVN